MFLSNVRLDSKSLNKLINGSKVIVKNHETGYDVSLVFYEKKAYNKLQKALSSGKGSSIDGDTDIEEILLADVVDGQGIMRKLKKGFNKVGKDTKKAFTKFGNDTVKTYNKVEDHLKKNAGTYVEVAKQVVPKSAIKALTNTAILAGTTAIGQPQLAIPLMKASSFGVNTLYNKDFEKPLKSGWKNAAIKGAIQSTNEEISSIVKSSVPKQAIPQEAIPILDAEAVGKGVKRKALPRKKITLDTLPPKPKALKNKPPASGGSYKPVGKGFKAVGSGFKPINGSGFIPIG